MRLTTDQQKLVEDNIGLVYFSVGKFTSRYSHLRIYNDDMISEGMLAISKAAYKFDPDRGRFSTFACTYIKHGILQFLEKNNRKLKREVCDSNVQELFDDKEIVVRDDTEVIRIPMHHLTVAEKRVVKDSFWGNMNGPQMARKEGITRSAINLRLRKALTKLRKGIECVQS